MASLWSQNPDQLLDNIKSDEQNVSQNLIYSVKSAEKGVSGTLQWISNWISSYIDWFLFFVWTWAVILIMYNGIRLMFFSWIWQSEVDKVKSRMLNLAIGVIAITWVYLILRFAVWFINFIFR